MGLIGNKITPNYGSKVKDRKTFEMFQLGGLRFSWENFAISIFFHIAKAMLVDKAIITSYDLNTLHLAPQVRNLPCIAKYLYYCRNDPFENVGETNGLQCQCYFTCLSSVTKNDLGCRFWTTCIQFSHRSRLIKLLVIFIMCNTSHFFCQIKYCKHLQGQSRARWLQLSELECDIFWQKLNSQVSLVTVASNFFSFFSRRFFSILSSFLFRLFFLSNCNYISFAGTGGLWQLINHMTVGWPDICV